MARTPDPEERAHLLKAGTAVMRRNGFAGAHITEILDEAGISTRAFYRHFRSKDDLLLAIFRQNANLTGVRLEHRLASAATPTDQLVAWIDEILDMGYDVRRARVSRVFASGTVTSAIADAGHEAAARLSAPLHDVLISGSASGEFPKCDPVTDAASIHALVWRLFSDAMHGRARLDRGQAIEHVLRFVAPALGIERVALGALLQENQARVVQ